MRAKKLLGSGETWRKQACFLTRRLLAWASAMSQLSLLPHPSWQGQPSLAWTTWAISGTECSVHWALLGESGLLSTSVLFHLQTTIGHHEAPWRPQYYPKGKVGNLALRNKWGFLQKHGLWDAHLGHRASQVRTVQIKFICLGEYCGHSPSGFL